MGVSDSMKQTLLDIVQRVAEFCNAGSVNSITDTRESMQIAKIVKETFEDLVLRRELVTGQALLQLQSVSDLEKPTHLRVPDGVIALDDVKYKRKDGKLTDLQYVEPMEFVESSLHLDPTDDSIQNVRDFSGILFNVRLDRDPQYYTVLSDGSTEYLVVDAVNNAQEHTLKGANVVAYGHVMPEFRLENSFIPPLSIQQFPVLISRAKTFAAKELKDQENPLEYDKGRKQFIQVSQKARSQYRGNTLWLNRSKNTRR
jgi:hypothetical protein